MLPSHWLKSLTSTLKHPVHVTNLKIQKSQLYREPLTPNKNLRTHYRLRILFCAIFHVCKFFYNARFSSGFKKCDSRHLESHRFINLRRICGDVSGLCVGCGATRVDIKKIRFVRTKTRSFFFKNGSTLRTRSNLL